MVMQYTLENRLSILKYYDSHGIKTTLEACRLDTNNPKGISRATLFRWLKARKLDKECDEAGMFVKARASTSVSGGSTSGFLAPRSRKPKTYRTNTYDTRIYDYIKELRLTLPKMGKDKLHKLLIPYCTSIGIEPVSVSTIGRIIKLLKSRFLIPLRNESTQTYLDARAGTVKTRTISIKAKMQAKKLRKPKEYKPTFVGEIVQLDAITVYIRGVKRYLVCCIDLVSRIAFAHAYKSLNSTNAKDAIMRFEEYLNVPIIHIQTDNGQENHKYFDQYLKEREITHFWNNTRSPKQNAFIERYNRTIQEEFVTHNLFCFKNSDLSEFKTKLNDYIYFYNYIRPHYSLQYLTPVQKFNQLEVEKSHM
jgi:transposase InsO family protein